MQPQSGPLLVPNGVMGASIHGLINGQLVVFHFKQVKIFRSTYNWFSVAPLGNAIMVPQLAQRQLCSSYPNL